jgi:hypothetical protein
MDGTLSTVLELEEIICVWALTEFKRGKKIKKKENFPATCDL